MELYSHWLYILLNMKVLEVQITPNVIHLAAGGLLRTTCGMTTDTPKGMCVGFTLNLKCAHLIGNFWLPHRICGGPGQIYICLVVIHRALVLPVSKQNIIQRQSEFRQPVRSVLNVKRSLKCPGPQLSQKLLGLWSALSTPETVLDILNQRRREVLSGLTAFLVTLLTNCLC